MNLELIAVEGIGEITPGTDLASLVIDQVDLVQHDVVVITQKIVSKAENRLVDIDPDDPLSHKPLVEREAVRILRRRGELLITETSHGFVCANAGIDLSNVKRGVGLDIGVIVSDTFGRPWRRGVTDVAIGSAGLSAVVDLRGTTDALGRELMVTEVALVDEIAAAADLVMGKSAGIPIAIVRGGPPEWFGEGSVEGDLIRAPQEDLFR
jgi:coenzyme F420-0:L-glutamate ligase/coenzyme F420-1:gamma-L-glutamate ligase